MHRHKLKTLLEQYHPANKDEQISQKQMLVWLDDHPDCFLRSCLEGHFTASACIINREGNKILLMHHAKLNSWLQPGGHCDGEGDLLAVARREAEEETGVSDIQSISESIFDIDIHPIEARKSEPGHTHFDVRFLFQMNSDQPLIKNDESHALGWFSVNDKASLPTQDSSVIRMVDKWLCCKKVGV